MVTNFRINNFVSLIKCNNEIKESKYSQGDVGYAMILLYIAHHIIIIAISAVAIILAACIAHTHTHNAKNTNTCAHTKHVIIRNCHNFVL